MLAVLSFTRACINAADVTESNLLVLPNATEGLASDDGISPVTERRAAFYMYCSLLLRDAHDAHEWVMAPLLQ